MITVTTSPTHRRSHPILLAICLALVLAASGVGAANAASTWSSPANSRRVSFAGATFVSEANENVDVVGTLHVVTRLSGSDETGWALDWQTNLDNTTGTGQASGTRYQAYGADGGSVQMPPGPPTRSSFLDPSFTLMPPGPRVHPPSPIRLAVTVVFAETGQVADLQIQFHQGPYGTVD